MFTDLQDTSSSRREAEPVARWAVASIALPQLVFVFVAALIVWAMARPRGPFSR